MNRTESNGLRFTEHGASRAPAKNQPGDPTRAAIEGMELYCMAHPGSPSAVRRPRLLIRDEVWIALLGPTIEEGIVGFGNMVEAALRAFDVQYLRGLRPPETPSDSSFSAVRKRARTAARSSHRFSENVRPVGATAMP